jgi:PAS domain S-box-containing protein/diguanylate cyclase (GGDEF)-like protein
MAFSECPPTANQYHQLTVKLAPPGCEFDFLLQESKSMKQDFDKPLPAKAALQSATSTQISGRIAATIGACVAIAGVVVLLGWTLEVAALKSFVPDWPKMAAATALGFMLSGTALWNLATAPNSQDGKAARLRIARICATMTALLGFLKLGDYWPGWNLNFDTLGFHNTTHVSPATALNFLLIGGALLLPSGSRHFKVFQALAMAVGLIGWLGFSRYLFGGELLIPYTQMAIHTTLLFLALSVGVLCTRTDHGLMALLVSRGAGGLTALWMLALAPPIIIVINWLEQTAEQARWFGTANPSGLFSLLDVISLTAVIWVAGAWLQRVDARRALREEALRASAELIQAIFESSDDAIISKTLDGIITSWNRGAERIFGYTASDMVGTSIMRLFPADLRDEEDHILGKINRGERVEQFESRRQTKDGRLIAVSVTASPIKDATGQVIGASKMARDITERKQAAAAVRQSETRYRTLFDTLIEGFCTIEMIFDADGNAVDYRFLEINPAFEKQTGLYSAQGRLMRDLAPDHEAHWFDIFGQIALTGEPAKFENEAKALGRYYDVCAYRVGGPESRKVAILFNDITERKQAEKERGDSEVRIRLATETTGVGIWEWNISSNRIRWDAQMFRIYGIAPTPDSFVDYSTWAGAVLPEDLREQEEVLQDTVRRRGRSSRKFRLRRSDDSKLRYIEAVEIVRTNAQGQAEWVVGTNLDITERKAAEDRIVYLNRVYAVLSGINTLILRVQNRDELYLEACRIAINQGGFRMSMIGIVDPSTMQVVPVATAGMGEELLATIKSSLSSSEDSSNTLTAKVLGEKKAAVSNDVKNDVAVACREELFKSGVNSLTIMPLMIADEAIGLLALYAEEIEFFHEEELKLLTELAGDISFALKHLARQEKLEYLSYYDVLTGLPNRTLFLDRLNLYLHGRSAEPRMVALILLDIERFGMINETLGRHGGDEVLRAVTQRLEQACNGNDDLARISADSFGVVIRGVQNAADIAHEIENKILLCFKEPYVVGGIELRISVNIGLALFPADGYDTDTLFRNAEAALKNSKISGDRYLFYNTEMNAQAAQVLYLETRLRKAVEARQFVLHYQPKIELATNRLCGLEALIRWQDPESGLISPASFIPLLEQTGLIIEVGRWVLMRVLADYRDWTARGFKVPRIAVNVSAIQLQQNDFVNTVIDAVDNSGGVTEALELEITESLLMQGIERNIREFAILRGMGIHIAIDDFGTGYSSLSYLARLPIDKIKIDRSFINGMTGNAQDKIVVSTIITLAHSFGLPVIAEGVETEEQAQALKKMGCDEAQGYLFGKPLPPAEINNFFKKRLSSCCSNTI